MIQLEICVILVKILLYHCLDDGVGGNDLIGELVFARLASGALMIEGLEPFRKLCSKVKSENLSLSLGDEYQRVYAEMSNLAIVSSAIALIPFNLYLKRKKLTSAHFTVHRANF